MLSRIKLPTGIRWSDVETTRSPFAASEFLGDYEGIAVDVGLCENNSVELETHIAHSRDG